MDKPRSPAVVAFWEDFRRARGVPEQAYDVCRMGDDAALADGQPRAIWRTKTVEVKPLDGVDEAFGWDEGEGERTREDWLAQHTMYFERRARAEGFTFDASMPAVFERFTLVWPPEYADTESS